MNEEELREIPSVDDLLKSVSFPEDFPRPLRKRVIVNTLDDVREDVKNGEKCPPEDDLIGTIEETAEILKNNRVRSVINGTGVVLHTNLGRAPYSESAIKHLSDVVRGYSSLEINLSDGKRGGRGKFARSLLCQLTGAADAGIVNNCSAALVLALTAFAKKQDVLISRGELIQIGGGFRIPEVLEVTGPTLREVGTTNKTSIEDYERNIDDDVGMILRVHRSNFEQVGFTGDPSNEALAELSKEWNIPFVCDLGSGALWDTDQYELEREPTPSDALEAGADLVTFSGDKLLGGPQAGLFVGEETTVGKMRSHPFFRALRCGKATLTALEATLESYAMDGGESLPVLDRFAESPSDMKERVQEVKERLDVTENCEVQEMNATVGGGALPESILPGWGLTFEVETPEDLLSDLREKSSPPIIGRILNDRVLINFRTIFPEEHDELVNNLNSVLTSYQENE